MFSTGIFFCAKKAPIFLRLCILSDFFKTRNVDNRHYELYISMAAVMQLFLVREIQLFKVK